MLDIIIRGGDVVTPQGVALCDVAIAGESINDETSGAGPVRRCFDETGTPTDPHLKHQTETAGKVVTDKRKDEDTSTKLDKIVDALGKLSARMDALEGKRKNDGDLHLTHEGKKDGEGKEEGEEGEEPEKARELAAGDSDDDPTMADSSACAIWRSKVDQILTGLCMETPRSLAGETTKAYKVRVLRMIRRHSPGFKDVPLGSIADEATFNAVEGAILADVLKAAERGPEAPADGGLVEMKRRDNAGRMISTFAGKKTFIAALKRPPRYVRSFSIPGSAQMAAR
jgi:hypothetical protein